MNTFKRLLLPAAIGAAVTSCVFCLSIGLYFVWLEARHFNPDHPRPPVPIPTPVPPKPVDPFSKIAHDLLDAHNAERKKHGREPLRLNEKLCKSAQTHADWMASKARLTHFGDGDPWKRIAAVGYRGGSMGENIAWNQQDVHEVMTSWMWSPGHRANILGRSFREVGCAVAYSKSHQPYWAVDFGDRDGVAQGPRIFRRWPTSEQLIKAPYGHLVETFGEGTDE